MKCRACMKANCNNLVDMSVAGPDGEQTLLDYFNDCTQLGATASDSFPKALCKTCTKKLRIAYSFRKCALESNAMFEKILKLQKTNTQSPGNLFVNTEDYSNDPLEIEFFEARKAVKQTDRESPIKEEGWKQLSSLEFDYSCDSVLINETAIIEQSQVSSCSDNNSSQADVIEDWHEENSYDENTFHDVKTYETDTGTKEDSSSLNVGETDRLEIEIDTTRLQCLYCKQIYSSDLELQHHVKKHLYKCHFCSKICTDVSRYYRHIKRIHNCSKTEVPASQALMKEVEIIDDQRINCKICNVSFATIAAYGRHTHQKHYSEKNVAEMSCDSSETDISHGTDTYVEEDVESILETVYKTKANATPDSSLYGNIYTECEPNAQESSKENLQTSVDKHNLKAKKKFLCSHCPRVLSTKRAVQIHERKQHLLIEPDLKECSFCQKKFDRAYLRKHIENVHIGERKFKCDICGNMYKTNDNVMRHRLLHTKKRNHPCTVCDKRFTEKSELKVHMRLHTGEKPFACHLCDRQFRIKVHLTYHLQQHARIKHKCNVCGKEFKHGQSLRNHLYLHTNVMPYTCSVCGYGSVKRDYFVKHMLNKHDKTMSVDELFGIFQANTGRSPYVKVVDDIDMNDELLYVHDLSDGNGE